MGTSTKHEQEQWFLKMYLLYFSFTDCNDFLICIKIAGHPSEATGETIEDLRAKIAE